MAAAKWQQADGAKKCEYGQPKSVRNRHPTMCENERKSAKTVQNEQKQAKRMRKRSGCFLLIVFWPFSSGHIAVAGFALLP